MKKLLIISSLLSLLFMSGCKSQPTMETPATQSLDQGKSIMKDLNGMTPQERETYLRQNPDAVKALTNLGSPSEGLVNHD